ncbi:hypothetical protein F6B41_25495 [Microbacterium lushaniae]|nr:hypothetical protein F6B41_33845 [Microbacterium lushaniae]KAA9149509.1 hypothetical protein F6B41_25495 [Microbacterium lushaniae]
MTAPKPRGRTPRPSTDAPTATPDHSTGTAGGAPADTEAGTRGNPVRAREVQHERRAAPFAPGNDAARTHGAYAPGIVGALAAEFAQSAVDAMPLLALDRFAFALRAWSHAEARCELIRRHLDAHGVLNARYTPRMSLLAVLAASERAAARGRAELGLSPESAARIVALLRGAGADVLSPDERKALLS